MADQLLTRAKKMVGALGWVPTRIELRERFADKGTKIDAREARKLHDQLKAHQKTKTASKPSRAASKLAALARSRTTRSYG